MRRGLKSLIRFAWLNILFIVILAILILFWAVRLAHLRHREDVACAGPETNGLVGRSPASKQIALPNYATETVVLGNMPDSLNCNSNSDAIVVFDGRALAVAAQ